MPRWSAKEQADLNEVRTRLKDEIAQSPPYPEVIGDRKIIRFLQGHDYNIDKVCELYGKFLKYRKEMNVNEIRRHIVELGADHPLKFPKGELILSLMPQLVMAPDALDLQQCPLCVEQYNFSPSELFEKITLQDYITYVIYSLEYRQLLLDQLSEEREREFLRTLTDEQKESEDGPIYGQLAYSCVIRDLHGVGWEHLGAKGQEIIRVVVSLASDNYPELMRRTYMINTPWIFNTVWYFVKGLLAPKTIAKVAVMGSNYKSEITQEIPEESLPQLIGGPYVGYQKYVSFPFKRDYLCPPGECVDALMDCI